MPEPDRFCQLCLRSLWVYEEGRGFLDWAVRDWGIGWSESRLVHFIRPRSYPGGGVTRPEMVCLGSSNLVWYHYPTPAPPPRHVKTKAQVAKYLDEVYAEIESAWKGLMPDA